MDSNINHTEMEKTETAFFALFKASRKCYIDNDDSDKSGMIIIRDPEQLLLFHYGLDEEILETILATLVSKLNEYDIETRESLINVICEKLKEKAIRDRKEMN